MNITPYNIAHRFIGFHEVKGQVDNPQIMSWLKLDHDWPTKDEIPWCSAFVNWICWLLKLERSKSLLARSWLTVGDRLQYPILAKKGFDIVVLKRGHDPQPGPDVINAPGHVGFFCKFDGNGVLVLGGNQGDKVSIQCYDKTRILGIVRLKSEIKYKCNNCGAIWTL